MKCGAVGRYDCTCCARSLTVVPVCVCVCVDELAFEPRDVVISRDRSFTQLYSVGQQIGR